MVDIFKFQEYVESIKEEISDKSYLELNNILLKLYKNKIKIDELDRYINRLDDFTFAKIREHYRYNNHLLLQNIRQTWHPKFNNMNDNEYQLALKQIPHECSNKCNGLHLLCFKGKETIKEIPEFALFRNKSRFRLERPVRRPVSRTEFESRCIGPISTLIQFNKNINGFTTLINIFLMYNYIYTNMGNDNSEKLKEIIIIKTPSCQPLPSSPEAGTEEPTRFYTMKAPASVGTEEAHRYLKGF